MAHLKVEGYENSGEDDRRIIPFGKVLHFDVQV